MLILIYYSSLINTCEVYLLHLLLEYVCMYEFEYMIYMYIYICDGACECI